MKQQERNTLDGFVRQAEHFGTEEVFETALDEGLSIRDLGHLALRLQNLDPKWKLTLDCQEMFVRALFNVGISPKDAARMAGVLPVTARWWIEDSEDPDERADLALRQAAKDRFERLRPLVRGTAKRR